MDYPQYALQLARCAKEAGYKAAQLPTAKKNEWLLRCADRLEKSTDLILTENLRDLEGARHLGLTNAQLDRLELNPKRLLGMASSMREISFLTDPVGRVLQGGVRPNGLQVTKVGVPLGVIFFIFESRPNVTTDAAALSLKSGNAIILRGGKEAIHTNRAVAGLLRGELDLLGICPDVVQMVSYPDREIVGELLRLGAWIDLAIPRGGEDLIQRVAREATMPVMKHFHGNCHVYVEASADHDMAEKIIINAKCQRPGVCNAAESILVDRAIARDFLPRLGKTLSDLQVQIRGCSESMEILPGIQLATECDYRTEYLDLILSLKIVQGMDEAISHINAYGSRHTDVIVTRELAQANRFVREVDSSAVVVNASSRFNDGGHIGLGAEIGISTDKYHARGPCGLNELTSYKYVIMGEGQIRAD